MIKDLGANISGKPIEEVMDNIWKIIYERFDIITCYNE